MKGFEEITEPSLNAEEKRAARQLAAFFNNSKEGVKIKNANLQKMLQDWGYGVIGAARVRKFIHYIRVKGFTIGLIATSKGYHRTSDKKELKDYQESLMHRCQTIGNLIEANQRDFTFLQA